MSDILSQAQIYEVLKNYFPGEPGRVLHRIGIQAPRLRADLAADGGQLIGVKVPVGASSAVSRSLEQRLSDAVSIKDFGAIGNGIIDETAILQAAINTGRNVYIGDGVVLLVRAVTISTAGQRLFGGGTIKTIAGVNAQVIRVLASGVRIEGLTFDGTASKPNNGQVNDMIRVESTSDVVVSECRINTSRGGGISILNSSRCRIVANYITNTHDNGILVANLGSSENVIADNVVFGTGSQNCIFLTADSSSNPTSDFIFRNTITGNVCGDSVDTGIEVGQHCIDTVVDGNLVTNCVNPEILVRDSTGTVVSNNVVVCGASGASNHDGIAFLEQNETNWDYRAVCSGNSISGRIRRSGVLLQGANNVLVSSNLIKETVATVNASTGSGLFGSGVAIGGASKDLTISGNHLRRLFVGVDGNLAATPVALERITIHANDIHDAGVGVSLFECDTTDSRVTENRISKIVTSAINTSNASGGNSTVIARNQINVAGYAGASPVEFSSANIAANGYVTAENVNRLTVPEVQFSSAVILDGPQNTVGMVMIQFEDGTQTLVAACSTATTAKITGTADMLDASGSGGFAGWALFYASGQLILQRRGNATGLGPRSMRVRVISTGNEY